LRNGVFNLLLANYTQEKTGNYPESQNAVADDRVLKFLYDADLSPMRCAMSLEIQEWSHKSRSKINNLYLLTPPILYWHNAGD